MMCLNEASFSLTCLMFVGLYTLYFHLCHIHFVLLSTCVLILYMLKHSDMCYCYFCLNNNRILNKINILYKMKIVLKVFNIYPYFNALCCFFFPPADSGIHLKAFTFSQSVSFLVCLLAIHSLICFLF